MKNSTVQKKLQEVRKSLQVFPERNEVVDGMITAVLARSHCFLLGTPGTAKSLLCESISDIFFGKSQYFKWVVGKFSTPEDIFGPYDFKALQEGRYSRVSKGKLQEAKVGFLDETFKCNDALLNMLLPIMNEGEMFDDGVKKIPLHVMYGASNELPQNESLAALYDRFVFRYVVDRLASSKSMMDVWMNPPKPFERAFSDDELVEACEAVDKMTIPKMVYEKLAELRKSVNDSKIYVSDRKWVQIKRVLRAYAFLQEKNEVEVSDFQILADILWSDPEQRPTINKLLAKYIVRKGSALQTLQTKMEDTYQNWKNKSIDDTAAFVELQEIARDLKGMAGDNRVTGLLNTLKKYNDEISKEGLGLSSN